MTLRIPYFLTTSIAEKAIESLEPILTKESLLGSYFKRQQFHIVVMVEGYEEKDTVHISVPHIIYEKSFGNLSEWERPYNEMAQSKAVQLYERRHHGETDIVPHLLQEGDVPFYGGVRRDGIIVACSGLQPWFDKMLSGMIIDICVALSYDAWQKSEQSTSRTTFI